MTVTAVRKDPDALSLTITAEFGASPERVWELWEDPRQLERWWGPPSYPATFTTHDLRPRRPRRVPHDRAVWRPTARPLGHSRGRRPRSLAFRDGFANDVGRPNSDLPAARARVTIEDVGDGRTQMLIEWVFPDTEAMERLLAMGMETGLQQAVAQIDAILAEGALARS